MGKDWLGFDAQRRWAQKGWGRAKEGEAQGRSQKKNLCAREGSGTCSAAGGHGTGAGTAQVPDTSGRFPGQVAKSAGEAEPERERPREERLTPWPHSGGGRTASP